MKQLAVVGCGRVLERCYLPALLGSTDWKLVAAVDPRSDRLRWLERLVPGIATSAALSELPEDLQIDAVLVATPPDSHGAIGELALRRGAHILVEKPMSHRLAEAECLLMTARACDRQIWVGFNRRFRSSYQTLRGRLAQSPRARVVEVHYELTSDVRGWQPISDYLGIDDRGGGVLDDIGSHQLDLLPWLLDLPVAEVIARPATAQPGTRAVTIGLRFEGGLEAWCHAGHGTGSREYLEITLDHGTKRRKLIVTRGGVTPSNGLPIGLVRQTASLRDNVVGLGRRLLGAPNVTVHSFRAQFAEWARAIDRGHSTIAADGLAGARCVGLVHACRQSLALGGLPVAPAQTVNV